MYKATVFYWHRYHTIQTVILINNNIVLDAAPLEMLLPVFTIILFASP